MRFKDWYKEYSEDNEYSVAPLEEHFKNCWDKVTALMKCCGNCKRYAMCLEDDCDEKYSKWVMSNILPKKELNN